MSEPLAAGVGVGGCHQLTALSSSQIRTSVNHLLCAKKEFSWIRHSIITVVLLAGTNILVIFVPSIRDIFGFIGKSLNTGNVLWRDVMHVLGQGS